MQKEFNVLIFIKGWKVKYKVLDIMIQLLKQCGEKGY